MIKPFRPNILYITILIIVAGAASELFLQYRSEWPRGHALEQALAIRIDTTSKKEVSPAKIVLENYKETRTNASRWSGIYWGMTFAAASFSTLAGLILKLDSFVSSPRLKQDIAAALAVVAALLMTISTSGDFQRKWYANRIAAAELELLGYRLLGNAEDEQKVIKEVGEILYRRHLAILGGTSQREKSDSSKYGAAQ